MPLPLWHYLIGAGFVIALTFVFLAIFRAERSAGFTRGIDLSHTALGRFLIRSSLRRGLAWGSVSLFFFVVAAGVFGTQEDPFKNILPVFIWVIWWVGFAFLCALAGNVWPAVNPWAAVGRGAEAAIGRVSTRPLPAAIGVWPATILFFGFAWAELVWPDNAQPGKLAGAILVYSAITWSAMALYGTERWLGCGETFSLLFEWLGRFAPLGVGPGGRAVLRHYGAGLLDEGKVSSSMIVFIVTVLVTVSFDGFLHTPPWSQLFSAAFSASYDLGLIDLLGNVGARTLIVTAGLMAAPLLFLAVFLAVCATTAALLAEPRRGRPRAMAIAGLYAPTLIPIAIAYHLAHYLSLLLIEGQRVVALVSDPFGIGWNLFGTAALVPDIAVVDARFLWLFSVAAVVAGHAISVILCHIIALRNCDDRKQAIVSQLPMLALMIGYTMLSLWVLAQPIVD
ncbi:MAG: hypothetical protein FJ145_17510 [Deltaproteobacteria bacterium]|nr:hypothetical protein [Deltaproteobacteria bacterium]